MFKTTTLHAALACKTDLEPADVRALAALWGDFGNMDDGLGGAVRWCLRALELTPHPCGNPVFECWYR